MNRIIFLLLFLLLSHAIAQIDVIYPREDMKLSIQGGKTFIFGHTNKESFKIILINGTKVSVYPNGTFIGWVDIHIDTSDFRSRGVFQVLACTQSDTIKIKRTVQLIPSLKETPVNPIQFDSAYLKPKTEHIYTAGDRIEVTCKGSPGMVSVFKLGNLKYDIPMIEKKISTKIYLREAALGKGNLNDTVRSVGGVYVGNYFVQPQDQFEKGKIQYILKNPLTNQSISIEDSAIISIVQWKVPLIARVKDEIVNGRVGPELAYHLFLPKDLMIPIWGKIGDEVRLRLSETEDVWVKSAQIDTLPLGTPVPSTTISVIRTESHEKFVRVRIFTQEKLPFKIIQSTHNGPQYLLITIYGSNSDTDFIKYGSLLHTELPKDRFINEIKWNQPQRGVYQIQINLSKKQQWGYNYFYEKDVLTLDIKRPPKINNSFFSSSVKGINIAIDPGHSPDLGAIGPSGVYEKDVNLQIAKILKSILEKKGANVLLTHNKEGASLIDRVKKATSWGADMMISIHANALPDGVNPFENHGTSVFYYQSQSIVIAEAIHHELLKKLKLHNYGLYYENLAVCRSTQFPTILIEPAFIMYPEQEILLTDPKFQKKCSIAIVKGIENFLKNDEKN